MTRVLGSTQTLSFLQAHVPADSRTVNAEKLAEKLQDMAELIAHMDQKELLWWLYIYSSWSRGWGVQLERLGGQGMKLSPLQLPKCLGSPLQELELALDTLAVFDTRHDMD